VQILAKKPKHTSSHKISKIHLKILCGFCRNTNLSILLSNFSSKNHNSKVYTYLEKVVVLVTLSTEKLSLLFLDFSTILLDFTRCWTKSQNMEQSIYTADPRAFKLLTHMPSVPPPSGPTAVASSPAARCSAARQTSDGDRRLDSPAID
jgi:hypothetical protein